MCNVCVTVKRDQGWIETLVEYVSIVVWTMIWLSVFYIGGVERLATRFDALDGLATRISILNIRHYEDSIVVLAGLMILVGLLILAVLLANFNIRVTVSAWVGAQIGGILSLILSVVLCIITLLAVLVKSAVIT